MATNNHVNARQILEDVHSGMDNQSLIKKYQLSERQLHTIFEKLIEKGLLQRSELDKRRVMTGVPSAWKCPSCNMPQLKPFDVCPQCGVILGKFKKDACSQDAASLSIDSRNKNKTAGFWMLCCGIGLLVILIGGYSIKIHQENKRLVTETARVKEAQEREKLKVQEEAKLQLEQQEREYANKLESSIQYPASVLRTPDSFIPSSTSVPNDDPDHYLKSRVEDYRRSVINRMQRQQEAEINQFWREHEMMQIYRHTDSNGNFVK